MSSAGKCPRALSAQRLGYESTPAPEWLEKAAKEGNRHEGWIRDDLRLDYTAIYDDQKEITLDYPSFTLVGHPDGIIDNNGQKMLLEIKTMSQYEFDRWMKGKFEAFPQYADQVTCYMEATGLSQCLYVVKNRSSGYIDKMMLYTTPSHIEEIAEKLNITEE